MYTVKTEQCKKSNTEILEKIMTCCICKQVPIPLIRDRLMIEKVYCTECAILNKIPQTKLTYQDKIIFEQLIIDCKRFCGKTFTYNTFEDLLEHQNECDYNDQIILSDTCYICKKQLKGKEHDCLLNTNKRVTGIEMFMNENFQIMNKMNDERFRNLESNQEKIKTQIEQITELIKELNLKNNINLKKTEDFEQTIKNQSLLINQSYVKMNEININKINDEQNGKMEKLIESYENQFCEIKKSIDNGFNLPNSKISELDESYKKLNSILSNIQSDSIRLNDVLMKISQDFNEKINNLCLKTQLNDSNLKNFMNEVNDFDNKIIIDLETIKKEIKPGFNLIKSNSMLKLEENLSKIDKMKSLKRNEFYQFIDSDSFIDFNKFYEKECLRKIDDPQIFQNQFQIANNRIESYLENNVLFGYVSKIILNAHESTIYDMVINIKDNHLITCSFDFSIKVWNLNTCKIFKIIEKAHNGQPIFTLLLLKDFGLLCSGGADSIIRFWDQNYNNKKNCINNGSSVSHMIQFNNILIVGDHKNMINFYEINTRHLINSITTNHIEFISKILILGSKNILLSGSSDSSIQVWNIKNYNIKNSLKNNKSKFTILGHDSEISSLIQLKYDDNIIVSCDENGTIIFHFVNDLNFSNYKLIKKFEISYYDNRENDDDKHMFVYELYKYKMLVSLTNNSSLLFWDLRNYEIIRNIKTDFWLFTLKGLENDEGILFSQNEDDYHHIIIWK